MPIYMDRHDVSEEVTAENVAQLHQEDLKVQDKFNCRGLTYWFDDKRKTAFCLVEAPNAESVHKMHDHAHGEVPHSIIEVDAGVVESFLGRIEDPKGRYESGLTIIDEPAFRFLISLQIRVGLLNDDQCLELASTIRRYKSEAITLVNRSKGKVVRKDGRNLLASFTTAKQAIDFGLAVFEIIDIDNLFPHLSLSIGLDAGVPVEGNKSIFEDTIKTSGRLCEMARGFTISSVVLNIYQDEHTNKGSISHIITPVGVSEMVFVCNLLNYLETNFSNPELSVDSLASDLGFSRSQFFRNTVSLLDCSPNAFLNKYRLEKSLDMLSSGLNSISETTFACGFSSTSYYSKCFRKMYGIPPKRYIKAFLK